MTEPTPDPKAEKNIVQSLAKGFRVLEAFTSAASELSLAEAARGAGVDNATAFRFLNTLVQIGYLEKVAGTKRFRLTLKCLDLGFSAIARTELRELARPILRSLVGEEIEAASLAVVDGSEIVYVERVQAGFARLGVEVRIGSRAPVYSTAVGHAILAQYDRKSQVTLLESIERRKMTASTVTDIDALLSRLAQVRASGYALSDQENVQGLRVLAAPVTDADGVPLAAVSVAAPAFSMTLDRFRELACRPVITAARSLSLAARAAGAAALPAQQRR
ncbi:MAG: IclR family transcriptional regulator [Beijerinckiaceae bacterium]